jgi:exodeoxyribonuclease-3
MKILNWNIVSLRSILKKENIIDNKNNKNNTFINFIKKYKFDILCLQEIKLCKKTINLLYDTFKKEYPYIYYNIPEQKNGYSGVAIISKIKPENVKHDKFDDILGRYIEIKFKKFYLINIYATNAGPHLVRLDQKEEFNNKLYKHIKKINNNNEIILIGDFNAIESSNDTYDFSKHHNKIAGVSDLEILFFNKLLNEIFINIFRNFKNNISKIQYSYFTYRWKESRIHNKGLLIDHALMTKGLQKYIKNIKFLNNIYGSDHIPLELEIDNKAF